MSDAQLKTTPVTVKAEGTITAATADEFRLQLQSAVDRNPQEVVIDISDVNMIDSKGLAVFVQCHKTVSASGGKLKVVGASADLKQLFRVMGLDGHFAVE